MLLWSRKNILLFMTLQVFYVKPGLEAQLRNIVRMDKKTCILLLVIGMFCLLLFVYPRNLKNCFLTPSALPQNFCLHSCLGLWQWSLAPDKNSEEPPCQIPNFSSFLGINDPQKRKVGKIIEIIPKRDRGTLELFFQEIVYKEHFGFTLFGDKPVSLTGYFDPLPMENYLQVHRNAILKNGWETWKKYRPIFPVNNYILIEEAENELNVITLINKGALVKTIHENLDLFQRILGNAITPEEFLKKLEEPNASLFALIHQHEGLYGIFLGYGKINAYLYHRRAELNIFNQQAVFSFSKSVPSKGFSSLDEEIHFLKEKIEGVENNSRLSLVKLPQFVGIKNHPETIQLRKKYQNIRAQMMVRLSKENVLDLALQQLCCARE